MTISIAFFLSKTGDLINVPLNHISTVIADPERFGLTLEEIQTIYQRHGERVGVEGDARREILLQIITNGWIRLRRYPNRYWSVTANDLSTAVKEVLREWARKMLSGTNGFKENDRHMPVRVSTYRGEFRYSVGDLAEDSCP